MLRHRAFRSFAIFVLLSLNGLAAETQAATAGVWKVTGPDGGVAYLGGSVHYLRKSDYPLPAAYTQAFDASSRMAFEVDERALERSSQSLLKEGTYRKGDSLKKHVDPRTYDYMRRVLGLMNISEKTYSQYRPWLIVVMLQSMSSRRLLPEIGVDQYFMKRAAKRSMPVVGLESVDEHSRVYVGLSDRESEILLLITFIPNENPIDHDRMIKMWRRGDADGLAAMLRRDSAEFPVFNERLIDARNRAWVPKIEKFIASGQTYFVIVGAGHLGGNSGVPALLRAKGYQVEQL
jgi:uncharacterized protein YbaP (TraB family)